MKDRIKKRAKTTGGRVRENIHVSLPSDYPWKVLAKVIADLSYLFTDEEQSTLSAICRNRDYDAYVALSESWGPQCTDLEGMSPAVMRAKYQVVSLIRKFRFSSSDSTRRQAAIDKFVEAETACANFNAVESKKLSNIQDERQLNAYSYARSFLTKLLGVTLPSDDLLTHWSRHGPGANLDTKEGSTHLYAKYSEWPYSCTKDALGEARSAIQNDERWLGALEDSYRDRNQIPKHAILDQEVFWTAVFTVVPGNRVTFVPKNSQTDRSIAIEPSMNLYLQLGIDGFIRRRLKRWGVDLDSQEKNRELARRGSLDWESPDNFVTLDLAAASDSISTSVCKLLLPPPWYLHLITLRSPTGVLEGDTISYEKMSSMGNGFTFALETAIFTSIVYGVSKEFLGCYNPDDSAVYGDDIIVRKTIASEVVAMLNLCGFKLNASKSFVEGPFRESCGADWFKGTPVRPVFLTSQPSTVSELWTDINRLQRTLSLRFMVVESGLVQMMIKWIPDKFSGITGPYSDFAFDSYLHVPLPTSKWRNSVWTYRTLAVRPKPLSGANFLFRKLMHDLRGTPVEQPAYLSPRDMWKGARITGAGSRFTITKNTSVIVGYSNSLASYWQDEYVEV